MNITDGDIKGLKVVELVLHGDARGFFVERYSEVKFADAGLPTQWSQDNHSRSAPGVLRGLHWQHNPSQGKLVGVTRGKVWDVAVDIRPDSLTFGQWQGVELSDTNGRLFWIPKGLRMVVFVCWVMNRRTCSTKSRVYTMLQVKVE
jgi:dTDP-4-dehydrorhamnose 3,5-epimerase and related enzymes